MAKFKDGAGRDWIVSLDVFAIKQVAKVTEVRLDKLLGNGAAGLQELLADALKVVEVLWVLIEEQAVKLGVSPEAFGRSLGGDALEAAAAALVDSIADFSPASQRKLLRALAAKGQELAEAATEKAIGKLAEMGRTSTSSGSATSSPASAESTPAG